MRKVLGGGGLTSLNLPRNSVTMLTHGAVVHMPMSMTTFLRVMHTHGCIKAGAQGGVRASTLRIKL